MAIAAIVLAAVGSITIAGVFRDTNPALAHRVNPIDARAAANLAEQRLIAGRDNANLEAINALALQAFRRDPTAIKGLTSVALVAAFRERPDRATAIYEYAERLSRRDVQTQLWLIEESVKANDIKAALHHYDVILRTSTEMWPRLFPILTQASANPEIAHELNSIMEAKPRWWRYFLYHNLGTSGDPVVLFNLNKGLLDPQHPEDRDLAARLLARLIELNRFDLAWAAFEDVTNIRRGSALVRDAHFAKRGYFPPFDWEFSADASLLPEYRANESSPDAMALYLPTSPQKSGDVVRQLLRLDRGAYQLRFKVGNAVGDAARRPSFQISCAGRQAELLSYRFPLTELAGKTGATDFAVPARCSYQWLSIRVPADMSNDDEGEAWVESVEIVPATSL